MKRMVRQLLLFAALLLGPGAVLSALLPIEAHALSCAMMPTTEQAYASYTGVIVGEVEKVKQGRSSNTVTVKVVTSYKGVGEARIAVDENMTWGSLWGPSEVGETYLFFLQRTDGMWENPLCSPTAKAADSAEALEFLKGKELKLTDDADAAGGNGKTGVSEPSGGNGGAGGNEASSGTGSADGLSGADAAEQASASSPISAAWLAPLLIAGAATAGIWGYRKRKRQ